MCKIEYVKGDLVCNSGCTFDVEDCVTYEGLYRAADAEIEEASGN